MGLIGGLMVYALGMQAQGIRDSLFSIPPAEVVAERFFLKEEAGMRITRIDSASLQAKVHRSLSDLLSENSSLFIKSYGRGALSTATFRGTAASHTQVTWNGIPLNNPMAGMVDFSLIPVFLIDALQIRHGGASLSDRGGGIGGSIRIENRADWQEGTRFRFMQGIGSFRTVEEFLALDIGKGPVRSRSRVYLTGSRNDYRFVNRRIANLDPVSGEFFHPVDTNHHAAYRKSGWLQELYFRPGERHLLTLFYWGQLADRSIPRHTGYEGPENANLNRQVDTDHRLVAAWNLTAGKGTFLLRSGMTRKDLLFVQKNRVPGLGEIPVTWSESRTTGIHQHLSYEWRPLEDFSLEGRMLWDRYGVSTRDTVPGTGYERERNEASLFLSARKSFGERVLVNATAARYLIGGQFTPVIPFLGVEFRPATGQDLFLKASLSRNYRAPALNELYWQPGGNPDLVPEMGFSMEGGVEYRKEFRGHAAGAEVTAFRSVISDWILWVPSARGFWEPVNIRKVRATGMETEFRMSRNAGLLGYRLSGTYAYTRSVNLGDPVTWGDASYGKQLVYVPLHSGNILVRISWQNLFMTYQYNAYSERFTTSSNDYTRRDWLYPYFMNDVSAGGSFRLRGGSLSLELKVYNLFNETYHSALYHPMPGRNYHILIQITL